MPFDLFSNPLVIASSATLREAMEKINAGNCGAAAVVANDGVLLGIISDGDIRRALTRSATLFTPVEKAMNVHPVFIETRVEAGAKDVFKSKPDITILPVVDENNKLIKVFRRHEVSRGEL